MQKALNVLGRGGEPRRRRRHQRAPTWSRSRSPTATRCASAASAPITIAPAIEKLPYAPLKDLVPDQPGQHQSAGADRQSRKLHGQDRRPIWSRSARVSPQGLSYGTLGRRRADALRRRDLPRQEQGQVSPPCPTGAARSATGAVVTGEVPMAFANMSDAMGQLSAGAVRPLAITTAKRSPQHAGDSDAGRTRPARRADRILERACSRRPARRSRSSIASAQVIAQMVKDPEVQKRMVDFGSIAVANTPQEFAKMLREETDQWAEGAQRHRPQALSVARASGGGWRSARAGRSLSSAQVASTSGPHLACSVRTNAGERIRAWWARARRSGCRTAFSAPRMRSTATLGLAQLVEDLRRRAGGRDQPVPIVGIDTRITQFGGGRNIRQCRAARGGGHGERPDGAGSRYAAAGTARRPRSSGCGRRACRSRPGRRRDRGHARDRAWLRS